MSPEIADLHPAQNRGFRELYATARLIETHWRRLHAAIPEEALEDGAAAARRLIDELRLTTGRYDLHGRPAAEGVGAVSARAWVRAGTRFLERNQALRLAVLDVQHAVTLLRYLAIACDTNGNADLADLCRRWDDELTGIEERARAAAAAQGAGLDAAVEPLDPSVAGRAAHGVQYAVGTLGEWIDRTVARRRA